MKKDYQKPVTSVELLTQQAPLLGGSVTEIDGNGDLDFGGGSGSNAHSRMFGEWDED